MKPIDFIKALRESDDYIATIYMNGSCYKFFELLKKIYPQSVPLIDEDKGHIVTEIDGVKYDVTGEVDGEFFTLTKDDLIMCQRWNFANSYWLKRDCPNCDEPVFAPVEMK
ncbi:hypothetical protein [Rossellomorea marisflavi]|uniref:hypothetical protein n=1 Tax=Rossellomorea marisflavi TaxID=189381 RepID=UPI003FA12B77